jgi:hypothetical protein
MAGVALALTALLLVGREVFLAPVPRPRVAPEPTRQVLRVWVIEEWVGSDAWLEKQAAVFARTRPGLGLRIRRAQAADLWQPEAVLPDVLIYGLGAVTDPQALFAPLYAESPVRDELAVAGRWQGEQWGQPLAMGGYVLLLDARQYPPGTAMGRDALLAASRAAKGKQAARYGLQCPADGSLAYPTALLAQAGALGGGWMQGIATLRGTALPTDFAACAPEKAYQDFAAGQAAALLGTQRDARRFQALAAAGKGFECYALPCAQPFTDQLLLGSVLADAARDVARQSLCAAFLAHLARPEAQQDLTDYGLLPVRADVPGYDPGHAPTLYALAQSLAGPGVWVPNAYDWAAQRGALRERTAMALAQGGVDVGAALLALGGGG